MQANTVFRKVNPQVACYSEQNQICSRSVPLTSLDMQVQPRTAIIFHFLITIFCFRCGWILAQNFPIFGDWKSFLRFWKLKKLPKLELNWKLCQNDRNLHYNKPNPINELTVLGSSTGWVLLIFMTQHLFLSHRPVTYDEIEFVFELPQGQTLTWNILELKKSWNKKKGWKWDQKINKCQRKGNTFSNFDFVF